MPHGRPLKTQRIAVKAIVKNEDRVLLVQRAADDAIHAGIWELPGGRVAWGEHPKDAIVRELFEETGLVAQVLRPLFLWEFFPTPFDHIVGITMLTSCVERDVKLSAEHQAYQWIDSSGIELLQMHASLRDHLREVFSYPNI